MNCTTAHTAAGSEFSTFISAYLNFLKNDYSGIWPPRTDLKVYALWVANAPRRWPMLAVSKHSRLQVNDVAAALLDAALVGVGVSMPAELRSWERLAPPVRPIKHSNQR